MQDDTNVNFNWKPSTSHAQMLTCSTYCSNNCAKFGGFKQYCGKLGAHELRAGGDVVSNHLARGDDEDKKEGPLEKHDKFQKEDLVDGKVKEF